MDFLEENASNVAIAFKLEKLFDQHFKNFDENLEKYFGGKIRNFNYNYIRTRFSGDEYNELYSLIDPDNYTKDLYGLVTEHKNNSNGVLLCVDEMSDNTKWLIVRGIVDVTPDDELRDKSSISYKIINKFRTILKHVAMCD